MPTDPVTAAHKAGASWRVTVSVDGEEGQRRALKTLTDSGFIVIGKSGSTSSDRTYSLANKDYSIRLGFVKDDTGYAVSYGVASRHPSAPTPDQGAAGSSTPQPADTTK